MTAEKYARECAEGREIAEQLIRKARDDENPMPLVRAMRDAVERGTWGPVETGLFTRLACAAIS